jgi:hypothetical protein
MLHTDVLCREALASVILHCKAPFGPRSDPSSTPAEPATEDERTSLHDASSDLTSRLNELVHDRAASFPQGQLDLKVHTAPRHLMRVVTYQVRRNGGSYLRLFSCHFLLYGANFQFIFHLRAEPSCEGDF